MKIQVLVSVIIPVLNAEIYRGGVQSILSQTS